MQYRPALIPGNMHQMHETSVTIQLRLSINKCNQTALQANVGERHNHVQRPGAAF